jgi:hypothetical protein
MGLWDVENPTLSRQSAHRWLLGCQPYTPTTLYPINLPVLISFTGWVNPRAIVWLKGLVALKKQWPPIWSRTCDLPACSIAKFIWIHTCKYDTKCGSYQCMSAHTYIASLAVPMSSLFLSCAVTQLWYSWQLAMSSVWDPDSHSIPFCMEQSLLSNSL